MSMQIDTDQAGRVASVFEAQSRYFERIEVDLAVLGGRMLVGEFTVPASNLARELCEEMGLVGAVLRTRIEMASMADSGWSDARYTALSEQLAADLDALDSSVDDGVGATGSDADARAHLARVVLGPGGVPEPPTDGTAGDAWEAANVTGPVLDAATPEQAAEYWRLLSESGQDLAIDFATPSVSDRYQAGVIDLDEFQVIALRGQPLPSSGRGPSSGPGTDWAGTTIPEDEHVVWAYDADPEPFADGWICSVIQIGSPVPAPFSTDPFGASADAVGTADQIRDLAKNGSVLIPSTAARSVPLLNIFVGAIDVGLCRLGVGSGYPIDTSRTVDDRGDEVYAGSRSPTQRNMDLNGLPLSPDPRQRDEQMWRAEHDGDPEPWAPYPGFPAYEVNAVGYEGGD